MRLNVALAEARSLQIQLTYLRAELIDARAELQQLHGEQSGRRRMSVYQAVMAMLNRTPEEDRVFWLSRHREEYEKWWTLEDAVTELDRLGADDDATVELVDRARVEQHRIHGEQADRQTIRDRFCD